ncbi:6-bladed beta-propeller [Olivibacter sp. 47]|uniref:6-bladed beta-propeller n=1 Tax=Olivibacter sp. 47 TaxID=3056486 RepID=UPI0025A45FF2|nr:6-bladed beta-propeller [Olivibacter sp. 47]MDM8177773.1 6-bladed beta-propeller [Olivibacter sp. 47]
MERPLLLISILFVLLTLYGNKGISANPSNINPINDSIGNTKVNHIPVFDPDAVKGVGNTSDFLDSVTFVMLETTPESKFSEITQLEITPKYYIIWDKANNTILYFDKEGHYLKKIANTDPDLAVPFKKIDHFSINTKRNELIFNDAHSSYMYVYTLDGTYKKHVKKPAYLGMSYYQLHNIRLYFLGYNGNGFSAAGIPAMNLFVFNGDKKPNTFFPFDSTLVDYTDVYTISTNFYNNQDGTVNFIKAYDYNVYSIDTTGKLSKTYRIDLLPSKAIPADFMSNVAYRGKRMAYTNTNSKVIYSGADFFKSGKTVVFRLISHSDSPLFVYYSTSKSLFSLSDYTSDNATHLLPVIEQGIHAVDSEGRFISSINAKTLFQIKSYMDNEPSWYRFLPSSLNAFYKINDHAQNPVLTLLSMQEKNNWKIGGSL